MISERGGGGGAGEGHKREGREILKNSCIKMAFICMNVIV